MYFSVFCAIVFGFLHSDFAIAGGRVNVYVYFQEKNDVLPNLAGKLCLIKNGSDPECTEIISNAQGFYSKSFDVSDFKIEFTAQDGRSCKPKRNGEKGFFDANAQWLIDYVPLAEYFIVKRLNFYCDLRKGSSFGSDLPEQKDFGTLDTTSKTVPSIHHENGI